MKIIKKLVPVVVLAVFVVIAYGISQSKPEVKKRGNRAPSLLSVEVITLRGEDHQVIINSFGKILPKTQGQLTAQVSGQILKVSDRFNEGSFFLKDDILVSIDRRDFEINVETAEAELAQARVAFDEEVALSKQAIEDRKNLGHTSQGSDFALRKPQMAAAKAKVQAASAKLKKAKLDVERTAIRAPYDGRIKSKIVDLGQMVSSNTNIADIYATDVAQIRLPIKNSELALVELPLNKAQARHSIEKNTITIANNIGGNVQTWPATVLRTTGAIDVNTQQLHLIAQIEQPFSHAERRPLNIGQFVNAEIQGKLLSDSIVIPTSAIYQGSYVYVLEQDKLQRRDISIVHQNAKQAVIGSGIQAGEQLVVTPLGQVSSGTPVKVTLSSSKNKGSANKHSGEQH